MLSQGLTIWGLVLMGKNSPRQKQCGGSRDEAGTTLGRQKGYLLDDALPRCKTFWE